MFRFLAWAAVLGLMACESEASPTAAGMPARGEAPKSSQAPTGIGESFGLRMGYYVAGATCGSPDEWSYSRLTPTGLDNLADATYFKGVRPIGGGRFSLHVDYSGGPADGPVILTVIDPGRFSMGGAEPSIHCPDAQVPSAIRARFDAMAGEAEGEGQMLETLSVPGLSEDELSEALMAAGLTQTDMFEWTACEGEDDVYFEDGDYGDLNGDGRPDLIVRSGGTACHGNTGTGFAIVSREASGWRVVMPMTTGMPTFLPRRRGGWPDIEMGGPGLCFPLLAWTGSRYAPVGHSYDGAPCRPRG